MPGRSTELTGFSPSSGAADVCSWVEASSASATMGAWGVAETAIASARVALTMVWAGFLIAARSRLWEGCGFALVDFSVRGGWCWRW